jgi:hypothetical protein
LADHTAATANIDIATAPVASMRVIQIHPAEPLVSSPRPRNTERDVAASALRLSKQHP